MLLDLPDSPTPLRGVGALRAVTTPAIAVVGTRHASDEALEFTHRLAVELAQAGVCVVSGGALGIDGAAHRGALHGGGPTVVVMANGLRKAYPAEHAPLFAEVLAQGGAIVTEAENHWAPHPGLFLRRNRLIAALSEATVVVEAPRRSGALSTARWAMQLNRQVFCVPGRPWEARAQGCLQLLRKGGVICTSARDVLSVRPSHCPERAHIGAVSMGRSADFKELGGELGCLFRCLRQQAAHPDRIARELDIPANRVQEHLLSLELSGLVRRRTDGSYCAVTDRGGAGE